MNVLFVCTGNVFRSVSAEYLLKKALKDNKIKGVTVSSAGIVATPEPVPQTVLTSLKDYGIDASTHAQRKVSKDILLQNEVVISMSKKHQAFIKKEFGMPSVLFNEVCYGKKTSVIDVSEALTDFANHPAESRQYIQKTITYIHDSMPFFLKNMATFAKSKVNK